MTNIPPPAEELRILDLELYRLDARRSQLLHRRAWLIGALRTTAAPAPPPPVRVTPESTPPNVQNALLTLGGILLTVAAIAFTLVSWGHLGIGGRSAVLAAVTLTALGVPALLLRRKLRSTAETVAALGLALTVLDAYALHAVALPQAGALGYAAVASAVLAALWTAYGMAFRVLRLPLPLAVASAQLPLFLWALAGDAGVHATGTALLVTAAFDAALALRIPDSGVRVVATTGACAAGLWGTLGAGYLSWSATDVPDAARAGALLLLAASIALVASWLIPQPPQATAAAFAGCLSLVAATGGVLREALPEAWAVPAYLACGVALLVAVRMPLPRPALRGIAGSALLIHALAALWTLPAFVTALLGPVSWAGKAWSGAPPDTTTALTVPGLPAQYPAIAALVLTTIAGALLTTTHILPTPSDSPKNLPPCQTPTTPPTPPDAAGMATRGGPHGAEPAATRGGPRSAEPAAGPGGTGSGAAHGAGSGAVHGAGTGAGHGAAPAADRDVAPAAGPGATPATDRDVAPAPGPGAKPAAASAAQPGSGATAKPAAGPATQPGPGPTAGPGATPGTHPTAEPGAAPVAGPGPAPGAGPGTTQGTRPTAGSGATQGRHPTSGPSTTLPAAPTSEQHAGSPFASAVSRFGDARLSGPGGARSGALGLVWAALLILPSALQLPYAAGVSAYIALTAGLLALASRVGSKAVALTSLGLAVASSGSAAFLALATTEATLGALGVLTAVFLVATALAARRREPVPGVASAAVVAAITYATAFACATGAAWNLRPDHIGLLTLVVPALGALAAARLGRHPLTLPVEITAVAAGGLAVVLTAGHATTLALALALGGVIAAGTALRADRRPVGYAAGVLFLLATWVRLAAWSVDTPEAYTLPVTVPALAIGALRRRRAPETSSWTAYGPGLAATLLPSLIAAWSDAHWQRPLLLGTAALLITLAGARHRLQAPLVLGGTVLALDALHELAPFIVQVVDALPRWLPPALAGLLLLAVGATYEQRLRDARRVRDVLGRMH